MLKMVETIYVVGILVFQESLRVEDVFGCGMDSSCFARDAESWRKVHIHLTDTDSCPMPSKEDRLLDLRRRS